MNHESLGRPAARWMERLQHYFADQVHVRALLTREPSLQLTGQLTLTQQEQAIAQRHRVRLEHCGRPNDPVAVFDRTPAWNDRPLVIQARTTDWASVCALDELGRRPPVLSANTLIVCCETSEVVLHRRSEVSRDGANWLHTSGTLLETEAPHRVQPSIDCG